MNVEKALKNYLEKKGPKVKADDFYEYFEGNPNAAINVIFKLVNEEIDTMSDDKTLDRVVEILKYIDVILGNCCDANRKIVSRKVKKLTEKLSRILDEKKKSFKNINKIKSEFEKVKRKLESLDNLNSEKNSKQYNFMKYLIDETKNVEYLEFTLKKMPSLVNVKDKNEVPLFRNLIKSYLESIIEYDEENCLYYGNLISLILSQQSFILTDIEKRKCLDEIYKCINKMSNTKKSQKKNLKKIELLNKLIEIIKGLEQKKLDIDDIAAKYDIKIYFDDDELEKAKLVRTPKEGEITDRKVVDEYIISIDGEQALEIDDALSCRKLENGNYLLGVHIASILGYFKYESEIVQEAINRSQAIYLPHKYQTKNNDFNRTIPIFPYQICADKASLKEGEKRLARSYFFEINSKGEVINEFFAKTIVQNNRQLTYEEVNKIIQYGTDDKRLEELIENLKTVTEYLDKKYAATHLYSQIKENVGDYSELRVRKNGSENIVYQSMLLTGNRVAEFFSRNNYPLLYRVHYVNEENNRKLEAMIDVLNRTYSNNQFTQLYELINGIYPKGWYAEEGRHTGLDLEHYCHCTSALRRAADIVVEHALEVCYDKTPTEEELEKLKEEICSKAVEINTKQHHIEYFLTEYQKKHRRS